MRREIPLAITGIVGVVFIVSYFIPHWPFNRMNDWFSDWFSIVQACAIILGALNLMLISSQKIARRKEGWGYAAVIIATFLMMVGIGFGGGVGFREAAGFDWLYRFMYIPLSATMFAILGFFVASASYRAFRARNLEASLLLVAAFLVMLGRVPVGDMVTSFMPHGAQMSDLASWIMNFPQKAGQRAVMIGIALGLVSTSLRVILGVERSHLGGGD
jgi:hypothetical protein